MSKSVASLEARILELEEERDRLMREVVQLRQEAMHDPLLPVYNRRAFTRELERAVALLDRYNIGSSLLYIDIDGFKTINDRFGHGAGDQVLQKVADLLLATVRVSDSVGRLGGDEFGILLMQSDEEATLAKIKSLEKAFETVSVDVAGQAIRFSVSVGYTVLVRGDDEAQALERADAAMYQVKNRKRSKKG